MKIQYKIATSAFGRLGMGGWARPYPTGTFTL